MSKILFSTIAFLTLLTTINAQEAQNIEIKLRYNEYPLCDWKVEMKQDGNVLGTAVTNNDGVVAYNDVVLTSKDVNIFLYTIPERKSGDYVAKGFIRLEDDYTGELDFRPVVKGGSDPSRKALEKAWGVTLSDCGGTIDMGESRVRSDVNKERQKLIDLDIKLSELIGKNINKRQDSLQNELTQIQKTTQKLIESGKPANDHEASIYSAFIDELEFHQMWVQKRLEIVNAQSNQRYGIDVLAEESKALKDRYTSAKERREQLQLEARAKMIELRDEYRPAKNAFDKRVQLLRNRIALTEQLLKNEKESNEPNAEQIATYEGKLESLNQQLDNLVE